MVKTHDGLSTSLINFAVTHYRLREILPSYIRRARRSPAVHHSGRYEPPQSTHSLSYWIDCHSPLVSILVQIIGKNTALSCLELDNGANDKSNESFNTLLSRIPHDVSLPLLRLVLGSLMSPSMIGWWIISVPSQSCDWARLLPSSSTTENIFRILIWTALQANSISEEYLNPSSHVSFQLMEYLNSYCGLEELELQHFSRPIPEPYGLPVRDWACRNALFLSHPKAFRVSQYADDILPLGASMAILCNAFCCPRAMPTL